MDAGFNTIPYQAAPAIWGSVRDASSMQLVSGGAPYVVVSQRPGPQYTMDSRGRLTQITFSNGTTVVYNYDNMGNRTSVVTTAGPHGL